MTPSPDGKVVEDEEDIPYVCPGCYAIGAEPHAGYCPDAAIERDREDERDWERDYCDDGLDEEPQGDPHA